MTGPVCRKMLCGTRGNRRTSVADELDQQIDSLFGMPLDRFIPERDTLAKQLRATGDREAADRVKALRKPTVPAWALNQLARQDPRGVTDVVARGCSRGRGGRRPAAGRTARAPPSSAVEFRRGRAPGARGRTAIESRG